MRIVHRHAWAGALGLLLWASAAAAQTQGSQDCGLPGGCGSSSKPGGVERVPQPAEDAAGPARMRKGSGDRALGLASPSLRDLIGRGKVPAKDGAATK